MKFIKWVDWKRLAQEHRYLLRKSFWKDRLLDRIAEPVVVKFVDNDTGEERSQVILRSGDKLTVHLTYLDEE